MAASTRVFLGLALGAVALFTTACPAPLHPHNLPDIDFRKMQPTELPGKPQPGARPATPVVMSLWTNETTNPVGGLYDWYVYNVSPLYRTYFHPDISVPMWEGAADQLRGLGYRVYKDYSDVGNPALIKPPAREFKALFLTGRVLRVLHDQLREGEALTGYEAGYVAVDFVLMNQRGDVLWRGGKSAQLKVEFDFGADLLDALGRALADSLHHDPQFVAALAGGGKTAAAGQPGPTAEVRP